MEKSIFEFPAEVNGVEVDDFDKLGIEAATDRLMELWFLKNIFVERTHAWEREVG